MTDALPLEARNSDVLIVGAGPAGIAAAIRSRESGARVLVIDDNVSAGGQIWRGGRTRTSARSGRWLAKLAGTDIPILTSAQVISATASSRTLLVETPDESLELHFQKLVIATGAREIFLPFPGWTLPGIMGVGGIQALAKSGMPVRGKSIVVAGSGPLLLAVAAHLREAGAHVKLIAEQAKQEAVLRFAVGLANYPSKVLQAAALQFALAGIPYRYGCWVESAAGNSCVNRLWLRQGKRTWIEDCDYAAIAYGLYPNNELPSLLGCRMQEAAVIVDEWQQSSVPQVYCAGECTGIGGVDLSLLEGEIAGYASCGKQDLARRLFSKRDKARRFASKLSKSFALREELKALSQGDTTVCRCEDVSYGKLKNLTSFRAAKLHTRCGMGPCQGRICGPAAEFLFRWRTESVRTPIFPARIGSLTIDETVQQEQTHTAMNKMTWQGVIPALTTPFNEDLSIDHVFLAEHCQWLIDNGCKGVVALGSLGEGATLSMGEKIQVLETCLKAVGNGAHVVAGVSSLSTAEAVSVAKSAEAAGCHGLMVLPPYVYVGDWREMKAHVAAILSATDLSSMLYNNPIAYKTDFLAVHVHELFQEYPNLHAVKESSADVRRITALRALAGSRLQICCGVDDLIVEAVYAGAVGWIAGLANAFPQDSVQLFELAASGRKREAFDLYRWFLPLLRMDTVPKFVQLIKLVQEEVGRGSQHVRPPRLTLTSSELADAKRVIADSLATHPSRDFEAQRQIRARQKIGGHVGG